ncbi:hypothetical protein ERX46_12255 [Brumimicrobium glaciale]|uniref:Uncharacterized protein n=1 Tax=Brumimicrobium glaciale TaxID=200475 RepID=A0A4Q4KJG5_9FLAO|nr:hypothetical protein [Brumimicrobium glaciale]RYM32827.1 hypothetical protein ERX46_12255 [Brumimicrobium glaciale]
METTRIEILNPKAKKLLNSLVELNLIKITSEKKFNFSSLLKELRTKAEDEISIKEITKEVEIVRKLRNEE